MPRVPLVDPHDPDLDPAVAEGIERLGGPDGFAGLPNVVRAVANHPGALSILMTAGGALYASGTLTAAQRELAYLTASLANTCHY
jgi:alkylhydroperoxidase family enzyme